MRGIWRQVSVDCLTICSAKHSFGRTCRLRSILLSVLAALRLIPFERVRDNLQWAADHAQAVRVMVVVEALNTWDNGAVILANTRDALQLINSIDAINIQYQYDVSHM